MNIPLAEAQRHISTLLLELDKGPVTITRHGIPVGVLISPGEYQDFKKMQAYLGMLNLSMELRGGITADEVYQERF